MPYVQMLGFMLQKGRWVNIANFAKINFTWAFFFFWLIFFPTKSNYLTCKEDLSCILSLLLHLILDKLIQILPEQFLVCAMHWTAAWSFFFFFLVGFEFGFKFWFFPHWSSWLCCGWIWWFCEGINAVAVLVRWYWTE